MRHRLRDARFPETKTLDPFDFAAADGRDAAQVAALARGEWTARRERAPRRPDPHWQDAPAAPAITLGIEAARQRRRVVFYRAADLVRALVEARDAASSAECCADSTAPTW